MIARTDLQQQVERDLQLMAERSIGLFAKESKYLDTVNIYQDLRGSGFLDITAPEEEPPEISFLTLDSIRNYRSGSSIKPGNIRLNFRKLMNAIPEIIPMAYGIVNDVPLLKVCGALCLWKTLRDIFTVEVTKEQAFTMIALWNHCDHSHRLSLEQGHAATNELRKRCDEPEFSTIEYNRVIDDLIALECIEVNEDTIWLREWVSKRYTYSI